MGLGRREGKQPEMWIATGELPRSPGHAFYEKLNRLLAEADFDRRCEDLCAPYYAGDVGRRSIPPGVSGASRPSPIAGATRHDPTLRKTDS